MESNELNMVSQPEGRGGTVKWVQIRPDQISTFEVNMKKLFVSFCDFSK